MKKFVEADITELNIAETADFSVDYSADCWNSRRYHKPVKPQQPVQPYNPWCPVQDEESGN